MRSQKKGIAYAVRIGLAGWVYVDGKKKRQIELGLDVRWHMESVRRRKKAKVDGRNAKPKKTGIAYAVRIGSAGWAYVDEKKKR